MITKTTTHAPVLTAFLLGILTLPWTTSVQAICEDLTTILEAERTELEFYTLPGAECELERRDRFICDWPRPHTSGRGAPYRKWLRQVMSEVKKLAGEVQQCINGSKIPYDWIKFRKKTKRNIHYGYYTYTSGSSERSIVICAIFLERSEENSLRLVVDKQHRDYCHYGE